MPFYYAGILPFGVNTEAVAAPDKVLFLLGREQFETGWNGSGKWSDFGGGPDGQPPKTAAAREGYEETMGLLGDEAKIRSRLHNELRIDMPNGYVYLYPVGFKPYLPNIYNNMFEYFKRCAKKVNQRYTIGGCPDGWYEKSEMRWFTARQLFNLLHDTWNPADGPKPRIRDEFYTTLEHLFQKFKFKSGYPPDLKKILQNKKL